MNPILMRVVFHGIRFDEFICLQQGYLSVIGTAFNVFCIFIQGMDIVKEINLRKKVKIKKYQY